MGSPLPASGPRAGSFAFSSFHILASSGLFVASASAISRSRASARRSLPCGRDLLGPQLHSLVPGPEQGLGVGVFLLTEQGSAEHRLRVERRPVVGGFGLADGEDFTEDGLGFGPVLLLKQVPTERGQGPGVLRRIRAGFALPDIGQFTQERQRPVELAGGLVAESEVVHAGERIGVVGAELGLPERQRLLEQRQRRSSLPAAW